MSAQKIWIGLVALAGVILIERFVHTTTIPVMIDYFVFYRTALDPAAPYAVVAQPFVNPPSAIVWLLPLAFFPPVAGFALLGLLTLGAAAVVTRGRFAWLTILSPPLVSAVWLGQVAAILSLLAAASFMLGPLGGLVLGTVIAIKPQIAWLAPLALLVRQDWKHLAATAAGFAISVGLSLLLFGPSLWIDWVDALPNFRNQLIVQGTLAYSVSLAGRSASVGLPFLPSLAIGMILGAGAVVMLARRLDGVALAALVIAASAVGAPYALPHDIAGVLPFVVPTMIEARRLEARAIATAVFLGILPALSLSAGLIAATIRMRRGASRTAGDPVSQGPPLT